MSDFVFDDDCDNDNHVNKIDLIYSDKVWVALKIGLIALAVIDVVGIVDVISMLCS